ncbi:ThiF family adenylyltransferase [Nonomuraea longispora]|uniref:ThiF family adenylyltransferase n=1 Tax=Nonomuraea longispora TaxID=1848320 RepID=A0A4R4N4K5_9ACTN|nr:ThiF family adenylyltransferase [Nonomuraea longispora]TDC01152.1 ThiF family adenylyltransferase [Nonomuraea longispora]
MNRTASSVRLRPGVVAGVDRDGRLHVVFLSSGKHCVYDAGPEALRVVELLGTPRTVTQILDDVGGAHEGFGPELLQEILAALEADDALDFIAPGEQDGETELYRKQISFFRDSAGSHTEALAMQRQVRESRVAVVGAGGLGSWVAQTLAMTGIGHIVIMDPDVVTPGNLPRQAMYYAEDAGLVKAEVLKARIERATDGRSQVTTHARSLTEDFDGDAFATCDLVVNCADEPSVQVTTEWISAACMPYGTPHIVGGGYTGHAGFIGTTIIPGVTGCLTCYRTVHPLDEKYQLEPLAGDRRDSGAFAPMAAVIANLQVWDAIRVLTGIGPPLLADRVGEIDARTLSIDWRAFTRHPACDLCARYTTKGKEEAAWSQTV